MRSEAADAVSTHHFEHLDSRSKRLTDGVLWVLWKRDYARCIGSAAVDWS